MKVVMPVALPGLLEERKRTGAERWDEMWDGVLHMPPSPNIDHQDLEGALSRYLFNYWALPLRAKVFSQLNVASIGGWDHDYRIPDILLLSPDRFQIKRGAYLEGAPDVVIELHSPGDEAYEKLPFYFRIGVPETWIIHRDTKKPEIYLLGKVRYRLQRTTVGGWVKSVATGVELRVGSPGRLAARMTGDATTERELPEY